MTVVDTIQVKNGKIIPHDAVAGSRGVGRLNNSTQLSQVIFSKHGTHGKLRIFKSQIIKNNKLFFIKRKTQNC